MAAPCSHRLGASPRVVGGVILSILNVAYPFAPVSPASVGGAEQVLGRIDDALVEAGHRSTVIACAGSRTAGELIELPAVDGFIDHRVRARTWDRCRETIESVLLAKSIDVVHFHGLDYIHYLPRPGTPTLITLHLPQDWYDAEALGIERPHTWLHGVSSAQLGATKANTIPPIENGVSLSPSQFHAKRRFALCLGRICPEKGVHLAIEAAKRADITLLIAGCTFPYPDHVRYFEEEVRPQLDRRRRFIGPIGIVRKRRLLAAAQCVLVPSLVAETSSLVAREALACGTPVVGFPRGALRSIIEHGRTGYLVDEADGMSRAIEACRHLSGAVCREAGARFSARRMIEQYFEVYRQLGSGVATRDADG